MSTAFRITQRTVAQTALGGLQGNLNRMQQLQEQLSSGRKLNRPSDSPVDTVQAMRLRGDQARTEQYQRNADDGLGWLGTADAVLTRSLNLTRRAREVTLSGMTDAIPADSRKAMAVEIQTLRQGLLEIANTRYLNRPLFAGTHSGATASDDVAYDATGQYRGDSGKLLRTVAPGTAVEVSLTGPEAFGSTDTPEQEATQLFAVLDRIAAHLVADNDGDGAADPAVDIAALTTDLGDLDVAIDRMLSTLGQVGARYNRVEAMRDNAADQLLTSTSRLAETESVDIAKTIVDLQMQEVAYQAALSATARAIQPSLVDFLR